MSTNYSAARPSVEPLHQGADVQVMRGSAAGEALMPEHLCTHEAVVVVTSGSVSISFVESGDVNHVGAGESFVIPAGVHHTLASEGPFTLYLTIPADAELKFL